MRLSVWFLMVGVLLFVPSRAAFSEDRTIPGNVEAYPTYRAVGIEVSYTGDENANNAAEFVYRRQGEANWRNGVDLSPDRERRTWCGSIFPCREGEVYEIKVTFADPDGVATKELTGRAQIRQIIDRATGGKSYFVSPRGNDENPGTRDAPFSSVSAAVAKTKAGDTVYVAAGIYRESVKIEQHSGLPGQPIVLTAWGEGRPVFDGSVEWPKGGSRWEQYRGDIYVTSVDSAPLYVAEDGLRMYRYPSLAELEANQMNDRWEVSGWPWKVPRAWYCDAEAKRLYIRTTLGDSPDGHTMNIVRDRYGFLLDGSSYIVIKDFEIRYYGGAGVAFHNDSDGNVLMDSIVHNSPRGVVIDGVEADDNLAYRNEVYERGLLDFSWTSVKSSGYARQGFSIRAGRGNSVIGNHIHGWFDGVAAVTWKNPDRVDLNRDMDIVENFIHDGGDDGLEPDGGGVNMRIWGNRITKMLAAISLAPIERGPVYVVRNIAYNSGYTMFKLAVGQCTSLGPTYVYHNSSYGTGLAINLPPDIPFSGKVFKNNAFCMIGSGRGAVLDNGRPDNTFDYNCYCVAEQSGPVWMKWQENKYEGLAAFARATGQELHGLEADPLFVDGANGDFRLQSNSPCIDKAELLRGINDEFAGHAPDIGAFEFEGGKAMD